MILNQANDIEYNKNIVDIPSSKPSTNLFSNLMLKNLLDLKNNEINFNNGNSMTNSCNNLMHKSNLLLGFANIMGQVSDYYLKKKL